MRRKILGLAAVATVLALSVTGCGNKSQPGTSGGGNAKKAKVGGILPDSKSSARWETADRPVIAELNGSPTDNNATLFKTGYDSVLKPKYDAGDYVKGPDQSVPDWDNVQAATIFEQMLTSNSKIAGVLAANDGLGNAA